MEKNIESIEKYFEEFNNLVGLQDVKEQLQSILSADEKEPINFIFAGNPGTGKTTVACLMGKIFKALGVLKTDKVVYAKVADLVAGYTGQTSIKTRNVCKSAIDGVLVVDEAHQLTANAGDQAGAFYAQAYNEIMTFMEYNSDRICVIFTGYEEEMRRFVEADPGMKYRILEIITFPDHSA